MIGFFKKRPICDGSRPPRAENERWSVGAARETREAREAREHTTCPSLIDFSCRPAPDACAPRPQLPLAAVLAEPEVFFTVWLTPRAGRVSAGGSGCGAGDAGRIRCLPCAVDRARIGWGPAPRRAGAGLILPLVVAAARAARARAIPRMRARAHGATATLGWALTATCNTCAHVRNQQVLASAARRSRGQPRRPCRAARPGHTRSAW